MMEIRFDRETCHRCSGSGKYPSSAFNGVCLKCSGRGWGFTPSGARASEKYEAVVLARTGVPASQIAIGDRVYCIGNGGVTLSGTPITYKARWRTVTAIESVGTDEKPYYRFTVGKTKGGDDVHYGLFGDDLIRVPNPDETRAVMREISAKYKGATLLEADTEEELAAKAAELAAKAKAEYDAKQDAKIAKWRAERAAKEAQAKADGRTWRFANRDLTVRMRDLDRTNPDLSRWSDLDTYIKTVKAGYPLSEAETAKAEIALDDWDAEQESLSAMQWLGAEGETLTLTVTVDASIPLPPKSFQGRTTYSRLIKFSDSAGNLLTWFGSGDLAFALNQGDELTVTAKVKSHDTYAATGEKQTRVTHVKRVVPPKVTVSLPLAVLNYLSLEALYLIGQGMSPDEIEWREAYQDTPDTTNGKSTVKRLRISKSAAKELGEYLKDRSFGESAKAKEDQDINPDALYKKGCAIVAQSE